MQNLLSEYLHIPLFFFHLAMPYVENRKNDKYIELCKIFIFQPINFFFFLLKMCLNYHCFLIFSFPATTLSKEKQEEETK